MLISSFPKRLPRSPLLRAPFSTSIASLAKAPKKQKDPLSQYYSESLNLPKTAFPLRAEAVKREKLFWKRTTEDLYDWQSKQIERPLFVLHDGPPYANGNLHCGHALNKITKDIINRSKLIQGYRIHYVPGFDTHGLPLELKALSALKKPASALTPQEIRSAARKEAEKGIELQKGEFKSFAVMGDWDNEYRTMDWNYEKRQLRVVRDMVEKGLIVSHNRPTLYSPSSRTALAEAELEYREDHVSRSVYVAFPVASLGEGLETAFEAMKLDLEKEKISLAAWTTTPWTLPSNLAIAVSPTMEYSLVRRQDTNELLIVASERIAALAEIFETQLKTIAQFLGSSLLSTSYTSVLNSTSSSSASAPAIRPIIPASYVTATTGTGLVHTSPAHGVEDFEAYRSYQSTLPETSPFKVDDIHCAVDGEGRLDANLEKFGLEAGIVERLKGKNVLGDGVGEVIEILQERGTLLREIEVKHKFPYDWRTKKPVIFRASSQWFANLENVKDDAVKALEQVNFYPSRGSRTLEMYVRGRSEWCISRQRAWGVPIPVVYRDSPNSGSTPLLTPANIDHIVSVLERNGGTDYWWSGSAEEFVEPEELERGKREGATWSKGTDTLDVWFDSGCSWTLLREQRVESSSAKGTLADVYFEGSDQHRGWFQSSLLTKVASTREGEPPIAPYKDVITHGMVLDDKGRKMSKSLGNVISPNTVIQGGRNSKLEPAYGTDLLRIWVASVDSSRDVLIGPGILAQTFDGFRKIRNTARFLLGNLRTESSQEGFNVQDLGLIERYVLHELYTLDQTAREAFASYQFNRAYQALSNFSNSTLSSFYFDVTKDTLYADALTDQARRQVVHTLRTVFDTYLSILSPLAPLLAEEIHHFSQGALKDPPDAFERGRSVFEKAWPAASEDWNSPTVKGEMDELIALRTEIMGLLEEARNAKNIGSSAEARVVLNTPSETVRKHIAILRTLFIVSDVTVEEQVPADSLWQHSSVSTSAGTTTTATILPARDSKCPRCWQFRIPTSSPSPPTPASHSTTSTVCPRCARALGPL